MTFHLSFFAGTKALARVREKGLSPDMVRVVAGAAGGPKWIVLYGLDHAVFFSWLRLRERPIFLVGSSIGAWRFAALSCRNAEAAYERFALAYMGQRYERRPTPQELTRECVRILSFFLGDDADGVLSNPVMRLNILANRGKGPVSSERKPILAAGLGATAVANVACRSALGMFLERALFYDPRDTPPFFPMDGFPIQRIPLKAENVLPALLASGSVPLAMSGIRDIPGAAPGVYRDGGLIDYHLDIPFSSDDDGLVLYPHYTGRIIPGWFDKKLPWRKPGASRMENVVVVCPSRKFIEGLPLMKIPDRDDFMLFYKRDDERIAYWKVVQDRSRLLGDEFLDAVESGRIRERVEPIERMR
jgi:hypothetical protein